LATKYKMALLSALIVLVAAASVALLVFREWTGPVGFETTCYDVHGQHDSRIEAQVAAYSACSDQHAKIFLDKDYAESKDLAKTFLTLLSAILVASITFSEKIVDVAKADLLPLATMIVCWLLILIAIVACGTGLASMSIAAGMAAYQPTLDYRKLETLGVLFFLAAGGTFVLSLCALIVAGVASLVKKRTAGIIESTTGGADSSLLDG
jgi:hypothetical protein